MCSRCKNIILNWLSCCPLKEIWPSATRNCLHLLEISAADGASYSWITELIWKSCVYSTLAYRDGWLEATISTLSSFYNSFVTSRSTATDKYFYPFYPSRSDGMSFWITINEYFQFFIRYANGLYRLQSLMQVMLQLYCVFMSHSFLQLNIFMVGSKIRLTDFDHIRYVLKPVRTRS